MMPRLSFIFLLFSFALPAQSEPDWELVSFANVFREDEGSLTRFYQISHSPERNQRLQEFYRTRLTQLGNRDFPALSQAGRADYVLIKRYLEQQLEDLKEEAATYRAAPGFTARMETLYTMEAARRRGKNVEGKEVARELDRMSNYLEARMDSLTAKKATYSRQESRSQRALFSGYREALKRVHDFYSKYDPDFDWWSNGPSRRLDSILRRYDHHLAVNIRPGDAGTDDGSGIMGYPIGRAALEKRLGQELIAYSPEELVSIAQKEFAWCEQQMKVAASEMGYGSDWAAALEAVKENYVAPGEQPEAMFELYQQSVNFIEEHNLITIPPLAKETWRMQMLSPEAQRISPFFLGGEVLQIAYPTNTMEQELKLMSLRGNNLHFSRAVIHHELIAGHHLQRFMMNRYRPYRFFYTPFWMEGWALYWEFLLWDLDFPRSPEDRMGMLFWRKHRAARIVFSLNYHLGKWTPQECIDFLVEQVGHERATAEGEVRRSFTGRYGPLYQIAYMVGALQFDALKTELVDNGEMELREFHDRILRENAMPVTVLRSLLKGEIEKEEIANDWKFYPVK